jgi:hypothetical protein
MEVDSVLTGGFTAVTPVPLAPEPDFTRMVMEATW